LIHGGTSGIGTTAIQLAHARGAIVLATAGSDDKVVACRALGASAAINYRTEDFGDRARALTDGRGVDVILDHIGARYLPRDLQALSSGGRVVIIGSMGGERMAQIDVTALLGKRQQVIGSTLRARPLEEKASIVASFVARFGDELRAGRVRPVISAVMPLERAAEAHRLVKESRHFGKVVLTL